MDPMLILDTETTGVDNPEVIQLAFATIAGGRMGETKSYSFRPSRPISWGALATHHILEEDLVFSPPAADAPSRVPQAEYWVGHNVDFDWRALGEPPVKRICTLAMVRSIWPKCDSHSLVAMTYFLAGANAETREQVRGAHGASKDVELCFHILTRIISDEGLKTAADLYAFSEDCRIPKTMGFGKYKGAPISEVDRGWSNWYYRQSDTDPYLITALKRAGKL